MHKFVCEMDLARTYFNHGKLLVAFECTEAAWDAAREMGDSRRMQEATDLQVQITMAAAA